MSWQRTRVKSSLHLPLLSLVLATSLGAACVASAADDKAPTGEPAVITVRVPAGAVVQFDGVETRHQGITRRFETPPLAPGRKYGYDVSVTWTDGGQTFASQRHVTFRAGERVTLNFGPSVLERDGGGLMEDPAAPNPSGTAYNENPLNWPVRASRERQPLE